MALALVFSLPAAVPPHVAFVLVDDWGSYDAAYRQVDLGRTAQLHTPTLDRLTREGARLDSYYVQHICSPTRSALLSGRYQIHTGLQDGIIQAQAQMCLPPAFGTMADAFKQLGYATHMVGKWHIGVYKDACLPWHRGFQSYYGYLTGSEHHYTKIQRIARGNGTHQRDWPDLRTEAGPVVTHCINPPLAPPPPPPTPCGLAPLAPCNYTRVAGYLPAGHDARPPGVMTVQQAERTCDALATCEAVTYELPPAPTRASSLGPSSAPSSATHKAADCSAAPGCKMYLKTQTGGGTSGGDLEWRTLYKHPPPPSGQGDPSCYSTHMFTERAVQIISQHAEMEAARPTAAATPAAPLFLYLALQVRNEAPLARSRRACRPSGKAIVAL